MVKRIAVLGSPISHSKSPAIQSAALSFLGFESKLSVFDVPDHLASWMNQYGSDWDAYAVTMPLKEQALVLADSLDDSSKATGSTNFLMRASDKLLGYNTDVMGIWEATREHQSGTIGVIGTGATARSALHALKGLRLSVWGRDEIKARELAERYFAQSASIEAVSACDLVISTIPKGALASVVLGDKPGVIMDAVYAQPLSNRFRQHISGIEMLIWQAIGQLRILVNEGRAFENEQVLHDLMLSAAKMEE